jgi:hypothetical protein
MMNEIIIYVLVLTTNTKTLPTSNIFEQAEVCNAYANYRNIKSSYSNFDTDQGYKFSCLKVKVPVVNHKEGNEK